MKCSGELKTSYFTEHRSYLNPDYGKPGEPEFITFIALVEREPVCVTCGLKDCQLRKDFLQSEMKNIISHKPI